MEKAYLAILVMGVSGSGKSTLGRRLSEAIHAPFLEADDFHSSANRAKMAAGVPLEDADRAPWLALLNERLCALQKEGVMRVVLGCSALKERYREQLRDGVQGWRVVYLEGSSEELSRRLVGRPDHFMPASLLESQLATLESPKEALVIPLECAVEEAVWQVIQALSL